MMMMMMNMTMMIMMMIKMMIDDDDGGRSCSALAPRPSARLSLPTLTAPRLSLTDTDRLLDAKKRSAVIMS